MSLSVDDCILLSRVIDAERSPLRRFELERIDAQFTSSFSDDVLSSSSSSSSALEAILEAIVRRAKTRFNSSAKTDAFHASHRRGTSKNSMMSIEDNDGVTDGDSQTMSLSKKIRHNDDENDDRPRFLYISRFVYDESEREFSLNIDQYSPNICRLLSNLMGMQVISIASADRPHVANEDEDDAGDDDELSSSSSSSSSSSQRSSADDIERRTISLSASSSLFDDCCELTLERIHFNDELAKQIALKARRLTSLKIRCMNAFHFISFHFHARHSLHLLAH